MFHTCIINPAPCLYINMCCHIGMLENEADSGFDPSLLTAELNQIHAGCVICSTDIQSTNPFNLPL